MKSKALICAILLLCAATAWVFSELYRQLLYAYEQAGTLTDMEYSWFFRLLLNIMGYATVLLPLFVIYKYIQKSNYFDKISHGTGTLYKLAFACFGEPDERLPESKSPVIDDNPTRESLEVVLCFGGLMTAYLIWGLLQEKIMTQTYALSDGRVITFSDSQFLVFINRLLAFIVASFRVLSSRQALNAVPLHKYSYCSLTNIISAWCQYEALKFVSFPTQVLSKSCKVIPVMIMGKLISRNKYEVYEYVAALLISGGMALFMFGTRGEYSAPGVAGSGVSGLLLLALYLLCDSFTSSWQGALFSRYKPPPTHMLAGVNMFSCLLTAAALVHNPNTMTSIALLQHPVFATDCILLSLSSAFGQMLIYRTISKFGPIVFTIIMTVRQAVSILLSCLVYGHHVSVGGAFGVILVFTAVFLRVYCRQRLRRRHRPAKV